jgi:hypothetical protein
MDPVGATLITTATSTFTSVLARSAGAPGQKAGTRCFSIWEGNQFSEFGLEAGVINTLGKREEALPGGTTTMTDIPTFCSVTYKPTWFSIETMEMAPSLM